MPDQFEALFAELRAETMPRILPPGVDATHRTVRRRRRTRRVAVAAAVLAVAGGFAAVNLPRGAGPAPQEAAAARINRLVAPADAAVDLPDGLFAHGLMTADGTAEFPNVVAGNYTLYMACSGAGQASLAATLTGTRPAELVGSVLTCDETPQRAELEIAVPADGTVVVTLKGDDRAAGNAGYALNLRGATDAESNVTPSPQTVWNADRALGVLKNLQPQDGAAPVSMTTERQVQSSDWESTTGGGGYQIRVACAGPGGVGLTVTQRLKDGSTDRVTNERIACTDVDPTVYPSWIGFDLAAGADLEVLIAPDELARDQAGFAYIVTGTA
ncbi:hypothetical protein [Actinoplanes sp. NPDC051494]|uniref:hypothetical protein n=1 Tax=Actinoplanes sp. NPDC051494 TaxID=3363907 RepID=UPI0037BD8AD3